MNSFVWTFSTFGYEIWDRAFKSIWLEKAAGCRGRVRLLFLGCEDMSICLCTAKQDDALQNQKLPELFSLVADAEHGRNHSWCKATTGEHT